MGRWDLRATVGSDLSGGRGSFGDYKLGTNPDGTPFLVRGPGAGQEGEVFTVPDVRDIPARLQYKYGNRNALFQDYVRKGLAIPVP